MEGFSLFNNIFGGNLFNMPGQMQEFRRGRPKMDDKHIPLMVTLEQLYNGALIVVPYTRSVICTTCNGIGCKYDAVRQCANCNGQGFQEEFRQFLPGFGQRTRSQCVACRGEGTIIRDKDKCRKCKGEKILVSQSSLHVEIQRGVSSGQQLWFAGRGDEAPNHEPGDCYVTLKQSEHALFKREKQHLVLKLTISITDSLCGFHTVIQHLDGTPILIRTGRGEVIKPGDVKRIEKRGMPYAAGYGDLIVQFDLKFPENHFCDRESLKIIESALPPRPRINIPIDDEMEEVEIFDLTPEDMNNLGADDVDEDIGTRIRCAHQ